MQLCIRDVSIKEIRKGNRVSFFLTTEELVSITHYIYFGDIEITAKN